MAKTLNCSNNTLGKICLHFLLQDNTLKIATKLYPADDVKLNNNYVSDAKKYFLSGVEKLDFKNSVNAANTMNKFVEEATNDKIRNLISPGKFKTS